MKIGIVGYGYVGQAMGRLFSGRFDIAIYDTQTHPDPGALDGCNAVFICVPTPMGERGECDTTYVADAAQTVMGYCPGALVCIKSAVSPGTTDALNVKFDTDVFHVSPEYIGEGKNYVPAWEYPDPTDCRSHDFVIVGGPRAGEVLDIFQQVMATTARYVACSAIEAELVKRAENAFLAMKTVFCASMAEVAVAYGVNWHSLREIWLLDSRVGRSHTAVFKKNPGFGGKCLPKDLSALAVESRAAGVDSDLFDSIIRINDKLRAG